jgi:hypothetical protein
VVDLTAPVAVSTQQRPVIAQRAAQLDRDQLLARDPGPDPLPDFLLGVGRVGVHGRPPGRSPLLGPYAEGQSQPRPPPALCACPVALDPDRLDAGLVPDELVLVSGQRPLFCLRAPLRHVVQHVGGVIGKLNDLHAAAHPARRSISPFDYGPARAALSSFAGPRSRSGRAAGPRRPISDWH